MFPFTILFAIGVPDTQTISEMRERSQRNLSLSVTYLQYKLVTLALIESIVSVTGGDGPISLFLGAVNEGMRIDEFLPRCACKKY